jgi:hypothetical protein
MLTRSRCLVAAHLEMRPASGRVARALAFSSPAQRGAHHNVVVGAARSRWDPPARPAHRSVKFLVVADRCQIVGKYRPADGAYTVRFSCMNGSRAYQLRSIAAD